MLWVMESQSNFQLKKLLIAIREVMDVKEEFVVVSFNGARERVSSQSIAIHPLVNKENVQKST